MNYPPGILDVEEEPYSSERLLQTVRHALQALASDPLAEQAECVVSARMLH